VTGGVEVGEVSRGSQMGDLLECRSLAWRRVSTVSPPSGATT
jgi:hypothetical protein